MTQFFYKRAASEIPCDEAEAAYYLGYKKINPPGDDVAGLIHKSCL